MARTLDELVVRVAADTSKMRAELRAGLRELQTFKGQSAGTLAGIDKALLGVRALAGGLGLTFGIAGLAAFVKGAVETAAGLGELAEQLGVSAQALQTYQFAAGQTGVAQAELQTSLARLTASLGEAAQDGSGPAAKAFERLGVNLAEVNAAANPTEAALRAIADAARQSGAGARFAADAKDVLGRSAQKLIPMLKGGAEGLDEFGRMAPRISDATIAKFDAIADAALRVGKAIAVGLVDGLGKMAPELRAFVPLVEQLALAEERLRIARAGKGGKGVVAPVLARASADVQQLREAQRELARGQALSKPFVEPAETGDQRKAREAIDKGWVDAAEARLAADERVAAEERKLLEQGLAENRAAQETIQKGWVDFAQARIEADEEEAAALAKLQGARADANAAADAEIASNAQLLAALKVSAEEYEKTAALLELNNKLRAAGGALTGEEIEANRRRAETLGAQRAEMEKIKDAARASDAAARDFSHAISTAFEDAVLRGEKLRGVLHGLAQQLQQVFLRTTATKPLENMLINALSGGFGGLFGGGNAFQLPGGGLSSFGGPRAGGGPVMPGRSYLVGERGPELFLPSLPGRIAANDAGGAPAVHVNISIDARGAEPGAAARIEAAAGRIKNETLAAVRSLSNRGGGFARDVGRR